MTIRFGILSASREKQIERDMSKNKEDKVLEKNKRLSTLCSSACLDKKEESIRDFLRKLSQVSSSYDPRQLFCDACRMFCLSLRGVVTLDKAEKDAIETEYASYVKKYGDASVKKMSELFAIVCEALEYRREDFLGRVYERLNATVKSFGQFFTPESVSSLMARVTFGDKIRDDEIVTVSDPILKGWACEGNQASPN